MPIPVLILLLLLCPALFAGAQTLDIPVAPDKAAEEGGTPAEAAGEPVRIGELEEAAGAVGARRDGNGPRRLEVGSCVYVRDEVFTGPAGKGRIVFYDASELNVGPDSEVALGEYVDNPKDSDACLQVLKLGRGMFRYVTGKIAARNPEALHMSSPLASIGIRGTTTDHKIKVREVVKDGKKTWEVEDEIHALRKTKHNTEVLVRHMGKTQVLKKENQAVFLRPDIPGRVRALTPKEMEEFSTTPVTPAPWDPRPGGMVGGAN